MMRKLFRKCLCVFLFITIIACLTGCSAELSEGGNVFEKVSDNEYLVTSSREYEGETVSFQGDDILIFQNEAYSYTYSGKKRDYVISIDFPNGANGVYYWSGNSGHSTWGLEGINRPENHAFIRDVIIAIKLNTDIKANFNGAKFLFSILLIGLGLFCVISPKNAWYLNMGWYYKNAEPSDMALKVYGVVGVIIIITGVVTMITGWSLP